MSTSSRPSNTLTRLGPLAVALLGWMAMSSPMSQLAAQTPSDSSFRAYPLTHVEPQQAEQQLSVMLGGIEGVELIADPRGRRLLVRGNEQVHRFAADALQRLDVAATPAAKPDRPPPTTEPELKAYTLTPESRAALARWQQQSVGRSDLRVAIDDRTSQVLVLATPDVHQQIAADLNQQQPAAPSPANNRPHEQPPAPKQAARAPVDDQPGGLRLREHTAESLHARLERVLARPLPSSWDASEAWLSFLLEAAPGSSVSVAVHRDTGEVQLHGPPARVAAWAKVIEAIDSPPLAEDAVTQLVNTKRADHDTLKRALGILRQHGPRTVPETSAAATNNRADASGQLVATLLQAPNGENQAESSPARPSGEQATPPAAGAGIDALGQAANLLGPVQIEFVEGLDIIVVRGNQRDVRRVMEIIDQIERLSVDTVPAIELYMLEHVDSIAMAELLNRVYAQVLSVRTGAVYITPLGKPNALLLIGRDENVAMAKDLADRLDQPVGPSTRFQVFPLKHAAANNAKSLVDQFLARQEDEDEDTPPTLRPRALVVADFRTNALIVSASRRDLAEIAALVERIDTPSSSAVDQVRVFPLKNTLAEDMAETLREAIQTEADGDDDEAGRSSVLEFMTIDAEQSESIKSGILTNIRITADERANAIVVTAPAESMELIGELIRQLDQSPDVEAELKVFTIANGDAVRLVETLQNLFAGQESDGAAVGGFGGGDNALVRLQLSVDERSNSIIAAGSQDDLAVVEAILLRLDEADIRERVTTVYRLKNAYALEVAEALNQFLQTERQVEQDAELAISPFEQIEREVTIVAEQGSNSLIVSATPRFYDEIRELIDDLDERPPMVMIQVLIAEVDLSDTDEFGVELGLQDSLLFDRSLLNDTEFITTTTQTQGAGGATISTVTEQSIINTQLSPGFNFNNQALGNNGSTQALANAGNVAAQGLSNFALGRVNDQLGFGGFVLSASSDAVNVLLRALQESRRLEVLSRPQIVALDGQRGIVEVGERVPRISAVSLNQFGQTNSVEYEQVGLILEILPRISPDGLVVMQVAAEKSAVGPIDEGIPISITDAGIVRAPRIESTRAQTTVSALSNQTVVLSGLLTKRSFDLHRRVPLIADIPLIGDLFRFDSVSETRTELLIILTPRIIYNKLDAEILKQVESSRMSWVMCDVVNMHGPSGLRSRCDEWLGDESPAMYPTYVPEEGEVVPYFEDVEYEGVEPVEGPTLDLPMPVEQPGPMIGPPGESALPPSRPAEPQQPEPLQMPQGAVRDAQVERTEYRAPVRLPPLP